MGVTNHLLVADAADATAVAAADDPSNTWDGFYCRGLDKIKLVALWALIDAGSIDDQFEQRMDAVSTIAKNDKGPWVDVAPPEMVSALSSIALMEIDQVTGLAEALWGMEDFEGWEQADIVSLVQSIGDQAESADLERKTLMVYTSL